MWYYPLSGLINGLTLTILGLFVYLRDKKALPNSTYAIFCLFISFWSYSYFFWQISRSNREALFWCQMLMVGAIFIPAAYFHFITAMIGKNNDKNIKRHILLAYLLAMVLLVLNFSPLMIADVRPRLKFPFWPTAGPLFKYFLMYFTIYSVFGCYFLLRAAKKATGLIRNQFTYVFIGSMVGYIGGATNFPLWYDIKLYPVGNVLSSVYVALIAYAILKFHLLDIKLALTRAGILFFVYAFVLGIPFFFAYRYGLWKAATWMMFILATSGPLIYKFLRKHAENIIFKEQHRYQAILNNLSKSIIEIRDIEELYTTVTSTMVDSVKIKFAAIYLWEEEYSYYQLKNCYPKEIKPRFQEFISADEPFIAHLKQQKKPLLNEESEKQGKISPDYGLILPCLGKEGLMGCVVLGIKQDNRMYTPDDLLILENFSYQVSLAIENCRFWKEIDTRQRKARLEEMDTFAYSLAHEIDNPMTTMLNLSGHLKVNFAEYIANPEEQKEFIDSCDYLIEASKRVSGMVKAIRRFGDKTTGELVPLVLQEVIDGYCKLYMPELKAHSVYFNQEIPQENIYIKGVAAELQQVLIILSKNAIHAMKFSPEKKIRLAIGIVNPDTVRIFLSDLGYGIKKEKIETIFAPFVTSKASTEGTGMGLYNAKGFILRHKGRIWAESEGEGKGATFHIELPIAKDVKLEDFKKKEDGNFAF